MNFIARAALAISASALAGVAVAASDPPKPVPAAEPLSKPGAKSVSTDRLERDVVERETQRRSNSTAKTPMMPAERG